MKKQEEEERKNRRGAQKEEEEAEKEQQKEKKRRKRNRRRPKKPKKAAEPSGGIGPGSAAGGRLMAVGTLSGRYEIGDRLGSGGMSNVYKATDLTLERTVAVKVLAEHLSDDERFVARFRREALAVARLIHPNIVQVYDTGVDEHRHFIVMEYVEGRSGRRSCNARGRSGRRRRPRSERRPAPASTTPTAAGSSIATSSPAT